MSVSANGVNMEECKEYRLSGCSTSTLARSGIDCSIYDTYAKDWNCLSARSTCTRSVCQSEFEDPSELTLVLKERRLTQSQLSTVSSDDSTGPPTETMGDTGGSTTPVTSRERSSSFDGIVSRQPTASADSATESDFQASLKTAIVALAEDTTSTLMPRVANARPPVILAKPVVPDASLGRDCPSADAPQSYRNSARDPLLSFRSYDSVHVYGSSKGQTSGYSSRCHSWAPPSSSRCHSWAPPSLHARECQMEASESFSEDKTNNSSIETVLHSANSSRRASLERRRASLERMISSSLNVKGSLTHQGSARSEIAVVDCCRVVTACATELDSRRIWSQREASSSSGRYLLKSKFEDAQNTVRTKPELNTWNRFGQGSALRSQSAISYAESHQIRYRNPTEPRIIAEREIPPSSPERYLSSSDLEITRDARGVHIGFKAASHDWIPDRILRSSSLEVTEDSRGVSVGFKEDRFRPASRSHSWVPPAATCESTRRLTSQSWAPPLSKTACDMSRSLTSSYDVCSERHEQSREILRPLPSSRVSSLDRPRDTLRPLPSSRVSSLDRPRDTLRPLPSSRVSSLDRPLLEASRDIVRPLHPSRIHSLAPPPDRQVRHVPTEPDVAFRRQRLPSPPRRKVSRQLTQVI